MVSCSTEHDNPKEKRAEPRARTHAFPVKINGECVRLYGYTRDISCSGMQVRAFSLCPDWPKPVGQKIRIEFEIPEKDINCCCTGEIVWDSVSSGKNILLQGIKFVDLEPEARIRISSWMKEARA